jgi:DNA modification methylase
METNKIYNMDCLEGLKSIKDETIDLTVTSPPYDDMRQYNGYSFDFENIAKELYRVTKEGGVVVWVVGDATINGSETGTSFRQALYFKEIGFNLYDTMIWEKTGILPTQDRYYAVFEYMFVLSKGKPKSLNLIADHKTLNGGVVQKKDKIINKGNKTKSDKTFVTGHISRRTNIWRINNSINETTHPAIFPEQLVSDHIISWSNPKDLVLDIFMGSGTTAKSALLNNRRFIGFEISEEYCDMANKRIETLLNQISIFDIIGE